MGKHGIETRKKAIGLIDSGCGKAALASALAISTSIAEHWIHAYKAVGKEAFLGMGSKHRTYDRETKLAAALDFLEGGLTKQEAMAKHAIASLTAFESWIRAHREGGPDALAPRPKGRPRADDGPPRAATREEGLEAENRRLKAEVAYLKNCVPWRRQSERLGEMPGDQGAFREGTCAQGPAGGIGRAGIDLPLQQVQAAQAADQAGAVGKGRRDLLALAERLRAPPDSGGRGPRTMSSSPTRPRSR